MSSQNSGVAVTTSSSVAATASSSDDNAEHRPLSEAEILEAVKDLQPSAKLLYANVQKEIEAKFGENKLLDEYGHFGNHAMVKKTLLQLFLADYNNFLYQRVRRAVFNGEIDFPAICSFPIFTGQMSEILQHRNGGTVVQQITHKNWPAPKQLQIHEPAMPEAVCGSEIPPFQFGEKTVSVEAGLPLCEPAAKSPVVKIHKVVRARLPEKQATAGTMMANATAAAATMQIAGTANPAAAAVLPENVAVAATPVQSAAVVRLQETDSSAGLQADDQQYEEITPAPSPVGWPPQDDTNSAAAAMREKLAAAVSQFTASIPSVTSLPIPPQTTSNYFVEYTARRKKDVLELGAASLYQEEYNSKKIAKRKASAAQRQQQQQETVSAASVEQNDERSTPPLQIAVPEADEFTDPERRQDLLRRNALASIKRRGAPRRSKPKTAEELFEMEKVYYGPKIEYRQGEDEWGVTLREIRQLFSKKPELASFTAERIQLSIDVLETIGEAMTKLGTNEKIPLLQLFPLDAGPVATPEERHAKRESFRSFRAVFGSCRSIRKLRPSEIFAFVFFDAGFTSAPQLLKIILKRGYYDKFYRELHREAGEIRSYIETTNAVDVFPDLHAWSIEAQSRIAELMHQEYETINTERSDSEFYDSEAEPAKKKPKKRVGAPAVKRVRRKREEVADEALATQVKPKSLVCFSIIFLFTN